MKHKTIEIIFILAGLSNIFGVLICSKLFTNNVMINTQPSVMGIFGLVSIILWGLAYIAVRNKYEHVRWLIGIFAIEKLAYVAMWINLITTQSILDIYKTDILAGTFYTIYGPNDFLFMLFFTYVFFKTR